MTIHVAFLRAINVGGKNQVGMADLRELCIRLGFEEVRSLLQSGNLVFRSEAGRPADLERLLESETAKRLGVQTDYFVRNAPELKAVVAHNPFPAEAKRDPGHLLVVFLKDEASAKEVKALQASITGREVVRAGGRHLYIVYPDGVGRSRLTNALIEKRLSTRGTGRNWNTLLKLVGMAAP